MLGAILTQATCAEACWHAREDVCRCSCGGANHGCLISPDGTQPERTRRIDGVRYKLQATDGDIEHAAQQLNGATGITYLYAATSQDRGFRGIPAKIRRATHAQLEHWPELSAARARIRASQTLPGSCAAEWLPEWPYLLWVRSEVTQL